MDAKYGQDCRKPVAVLYTKLWVVMSSLFMRHICLVCNFLTLVCSIFSSAICVKFGQVVQCSQIKEVIVHDDTSYIQGSVDNHGHGHKKYVH